MAFKDGDFIEIEYTAWNAADNGVIFTTDEKKAKEAGIYDEKGRYGPVLVVLGSRSVVKGLEKGLHEMSLNETKRFELSPEEAFGERSEELVKVIPLSEFRKRDIAPYPGMSIDIDNMPAIVKSVNSGRVVVDANHPYAGRKIVYEVKVVKQLLDDKEKIQGLGKVYNVEPTTVEISGDVAKLGYGKDFNKDANYFVNKANLIASIFSYFEKIKKVEIKEDYERPAEQKEKDEKDNKAENKA
ncbi:MAG: FKBP-type peptidyl-prolyl cis-trans isomerase [Candidatus Micrarchaeia archaeon]